MKKIILLATIVFLTSTAFTQISFGPKIGYYTSDLSVDKSTIKSELKSSFQFGAFLRLGTKIYVQPEIIWATEGAVFKEDGFGFEEDVELRTIQIPLLIGVKVFDLKVANLRIHVGPTASIVTDKKIKEFSDLGFSDVDFEDLIWSFQIGAGIDVLMLTLDLRYNIGISKVIGEVDGIAYDSKTNGFNVSLGWKIL